MKETRYCKHCGNGTYSKSTDTVLCRCSNRTILVNKANDCEEYADKAAVRRLKEQGRFNPDA